MDKSRTAPKNIEEAAHRIILPLDVDTLEEAERLARSLEGSVEIFKAGYQFTNRVGTPRAVEAIHSWGGKTFLDHKYYDIGNTMANAAKAAAEMGVELFNVHTSASSKGIRKAVENAGESMVFGVTLLTTMTIADAKEVYNCEAIDELVLRLAQIGLRGGVHGFISSPLELATVFNQDHPEFSECICITPGVRPEWAPSDDQKRVATPFEAVRDGADYLVIGRPIYRPPAGFTCVSAVERIAEEILQGYLARKAA